MIKHQFIMFYSVAVLENWNKLTPSQQRKIKGELLTKDIVTAVDLHPEISVVYVASETVNTSISISKRGKISHITRIKSTKEDYWKLLEV